MKPIDIALIILYLIATIVIGYRSGRSVKTMEDFSVSDKNFPTTALVATVFATWVGGDDLVGEGERIYTVGIIFLVVLLSQIISLVLHAYFIAPKILKDFSDKISIGEIMGELYGDIGRILTGIATIAVSIGYIAAQISCIGYVCSFIPGVTHFWGTVIGSFVVIMYSAYGGIKAIVSTDILQFGIAIIAVPVVANIALYNTGGLEVLIQKLPDYYLSVSPSRSDFWYNFGMILVCAVPYFNPTLTQRILMAKDARQASQSLVIVGGLFVPFYVATAVIALCAIIDIPGTDPNMVFLNMLDKSLPSIVKGFAAVGFLAVVMSTADSHINVASISITRDIAAVMFPMINSKTQLNIARIFTILLGISSIFIATKFYSMIDFFVYFSNFWMPIVAAPMALYMFGIKTNTRQYVTGCIVGFIAIILVRSLEIEELTVTSSLTGMLFTCLTMLGLYKFSDSNSYLLKLGKQHKNEFF